MGAPGRPATAPLRFGCPLQFQDRWQGTLAGVEVDESWEVLNVVLERGISFGRARVKVAFSAASDWSYDTLMLSCTSSQAFGREIPPIAAPSRPLSTRTALAISGARLVGLLIEPGRRLATDVIVQRDADKYTAPVSSVTHDGKVLHMPEHGPAPYLTDEQLVETARQILIGNKRITGDERSALDVHASSGVVTIEGNVRTGQMKHIIETSLSPLRAKSEILSNIVDDIDLELAIGRALDRAGLQHRAEVYPRSLLGDITLFGRADSAALVDDIARAVSQVPGVRSVTSRMVIGGAQASPARSR